MCGLLRLQLRMKASRAVTPPESAIKLQQALLYRVLNSIAATAVIT
jgi:hypothetical protein